MTERVHSLPAIAATVPQLSVGPMVLNVANRPAGTLAVMAATLQQISNGRLLLGLGAGGGINTPYAAEQLALNRPVPPDPIRREQLETTVSSLRMVWSDDRLRGVSELRDVRRGVDADKLRNPSERFPDYDRVDLVDWHEETMHGHEEPHSLLPWSFS